MRKLFWSGTILILAACIVALGLGRHGSWSGNSSTNGEPDVAYDEEYTPPAEPKMVVDVLPEQPIPIEAPPQVEVINVLETRLAALRLREAAQNEKALPEPGIPVIYEADDQEYGPMPFCVDEEDEVPAQMPYVEESPLPRSKPCSAQKPKESCPAKEKRTATFVGLPLPF